MATILYLILILFCVAMIVGGLRVPARVYQFPFAAAAVFLGFIAPQLFGLLGADYLPKWALERYIFMCILSLLMCWLGDCAARRRSLGNIAPSEYDPRRWLVGATLLTLVGSLAYIKSRSLFQAGFDTSSGTIVAVNFFVALLRYGFIMASIHLLRNKSKYAFVLVLMATMFYLDRIVLLGRRQDTIEFAFVLAGSAWFVLHKALPRTVVVASFVLFTALFFSVGEYRSVVVSRSGERDWSKLQELDIKKSIEKVALQGGTETVAGVHFTAACADALAFDFGLSQWNGLIYSYVPAQVFGSEFKESLYLPVPNLVEIAYTRYGYVRPTGSTVTGVVGCYASFWYFGCLEFFVIAYIMHRLYRRAIDGSAIAQAIYLFMMTNAMHAITHSTIRFVSPWVHILVFWIPLLYYAIGKSLSIRASELPSDFVYTRNLLWDQTER